jgi:hypothetical protein
VASPRDHHAARVTDMIKSYWLAVGRIVDPIRLLGSAALIRVAHALVELRDPEPVGAGERAVGR